MQVLRKAYKSAVRAIMGYEYRTVHIDNKGKRKVFHCTTLADAQEWVSCALNDDTVKITSRDGYLVAQRNAIKV